MDFSNTIMELRYSWDKEDGKKETWDEICNRVVDSVFSARDFLGKEEIKEKMKKYMYQRKFIPGGRFLAQSGREFHQVNNCFLLRAEDTREGWGDLLEKATLMLSSGGGIGIDYSDLRPKGAKLKRSGGTSSGPLPLMNVVNEVGRGVMAGGNRRCLPEGTLVDTNQGLIPIEDIESGMLAKTTTGYFKITGKIEQGIQDTIVIETQNGNLECTPNHRVAVFSKVGEYVFKMAKDLSVGDRLVFNQTPSSFSKEYSLPESDYVRSKNAYTVKEITIPELDEDIAWLLGNFHGNGFVSVFEQQKKGKRNGRVSIACSKNYPKTIEKAKKQLERFGINVKTIDYKNYVELVVASVPLALYFLKFKKPNENMKVPEFILNNKNINIRAAYVAGLFDADGSEKSRPLNLVSSVYPNYVYELQNLVSSLGIATRMKLRRKAKGNWKNLYVLNVASRSQFDLTEKIIMRFSTKYSFSREIKNAQYSYSYSPEMIRDSFEKLPKEIKNRTAPYSFEFIHSLAGIENNIIPVSVLAISKGRTVETYDIEVEKMNEFTTNGYIVHNSALWSGLRWSHPDVFEFITIKNWSDEVKKIKEKDFNFPATMDMTNISVILDKDFFDAYYDKENPKHEHAQKVYWMVIEQMVMTGEPGFSVDYDNPRESLRNACFTFDTPILTKDGYAEIGSLENKKFEIISYDGTISNGKVWFSGIKEIIELNLSNGEKIRCTPNHVFMNSNGESVEAKDLKGQKLYPYSKDFENAPAVISIKNAGIEKVYDFNEPENNWGIVQGYVVHNCTEIVSEDDSDVCCLGSINLPKISSKEELAEITELSQLFLICGILYSDVPHEKVKEVKNKNMRTGLGIMGFHEWLIRHGYKYEPNAELGEWLSVWKESSDNAAEKWAKILNIPVPIKRRAIAPNGSISIAGGQTTSGIEPIFSLAYQRRYLTPEGWKKQYVVDFVAEKLHEEGFDLSGVEDAYSLSFDVERRIAFQEFVQKYVDNSISSTINLPAYGTPGNNNPKEFGEILIKYLPKLRGITVYPDGARGGQPLTPVPFEFAIDKKGVVFEGHEECVGGVCGL